MITRRRTVIRDRDSDGNIIGDEFIEFYYTRADLDEELVEVQEEMDIIDPSGRPDMPPERKARMKRLTRRKAHIQQALGELDRECAECP